jgi:hypothetical protein
MNPGIELHRTLRAPRLGVGIAASASLLCLFLSSLCGCGSSDTNTPPVSGGIKITDKNNYKAENTLKLPIIETTAGPAAAQLDISFGTLTQDFKCHDIVPQTEVKNVAVLRFTNLTEAELEKKLPSGSIDANDPDLDEYYNFITDGSTTHVPLSSLATIEEKPISISKDYVEETTDNTYAYVFVASRNTTPGVGALTMAFLRPTASSPSNVIDVPTGCGALTSKIDLHSGDALQIPAAGPWVVDWSKITQDGEGNDVIFSRIDNLMLGFYKDMTVADLEKIPFDIETMPDPVYELRIDNQKSRDLGMAQERTSKDFFAGFDRTDGTWLMALYCNTCQNPAPLVVTIIDPTP